MITYSLCVKYTYSANILKHDRRANETHTQKLYIHCDPSQWEYAYRIMLLALHQKFNSFKSFGVVGDTTVAAAAFAIIHECSAPPFISF